MRSLMQSVSEVDFVLIIQYVSKFSCFDSYIIILYLAGFAINVVCYCYLFYRYIVRPLLQKAMYFFARLSNHTKNYQKRYRSHGVLRGM
jgi:hypothetical protein